ARPAGRARRLPPGIEQLSESSSTPAWMWMREKRHYCTRGTIYGDRAHLQVKTRPGRLSVVQVNYAYDKALTDPDALLARYFTLTGWSDALVRAGAGPAAVVQQFHRD